LLEVGVGCDDDQPEGVPLAEAVKAGGLAFELLRRKAVCLSV
jgi:hypothetical protein